MKVCKERPKAQLSSLSSDKYAKELSIVIAGLLRHPAASCIKTKDFPLGKVLEFAIQLCLSNSVKMRENRKEWGLQWIFAQSDEHTKFL